MSQQAVVSLTSEEEQTLRLWARAGTSEQRLVERAKVILLVDQGVANVEIARRLKTRPARVSKWRRRFAEQRLDGLRDADRKGRPSVYDQATDKRVLTQLDEPPPSGYGKWSGPLLAQALGDVSDDQVWRILRKYVGGGEKGRQFGGREGARCVVTLWPAVGAGMERKRLLLL